MFSKAGQYCVQSERTELPRKLIAGSRTFPSRMVNGCVGVVPTVPSALAKPKTGKALLIARGWLVSLVLASTPDPTNWLRTVASAPDWVVRPLVVSLDQSTVPQSASSL